MSKEIYGWYGFELPNRPTQCTYGFWPKEKIPKLENIKYSHVVDLEQLKSFLFETDKKSMLFQSPTDCTFTFREPNIFYVDSQDCLFWKIDKKRRVCTDDDCIVSDSLPEFLTRIELENSIWYKHHYKKSFDLIEENYIDKLKIFVNK